MICDKFAAEGCHIAINYNESKARAEEVAEKTSREHGVRAIIVQGDVGVLSDCERIVQTAIDGLNGLDIIVANAVSIQKEGMKFNYSYYPPLTFLR